MRVFAASPSGRFVAISKEKQLLRRRPQATEERFPFTILDTETGSEFTFFQYMENSFESSAYDYHTSRRPENVFFGVLNRGQVYSLLKESNMTGQELAKSGAGCKTAGLTLVKSS